MNAIIGIDFANGLDETVLQKEIEIKYNCGHSSLRKICGYSRCVEIQGSMEEQIERKVKYFEEMNCAECQCSR